MSPMALLVAMMLAGCGGSSGSSSGVQNLGVATENLGSNTNAGVGTVASPIGSEIASTGDGLTEDQKYSLAYMWHEEKLAKDVYLELYKINPAQQLENIATNSEVKHIKLVQNLVAAYDINITNLANYEVNYSVEELNAMPVGKFAVPKIQELYDVLYSKGSASKQASLEVGCMVEVTDIDDLDHFIATANNNQAIIDTFTILRAGSYTHYWAFDKGLKNMGVTDGCCSLGSTYCHPEYPQK